MAKDKDIVSYNEDKVVLSNTLSSVPEAVIPKTTRNSAGNDGSNLYGEAVGYIESIGRAVTSIADDKAAEIFSKPLYDLSKSDYNQYVQFLQFYKKSAQGNQVDANIKAAISELNKFEANRLVYAMSWTKPNTEQRKEALKDFVQPHIDRLIQNQDYDGLQVMLTRFKEKDKGLDNEGYKAVRDYLYEKSEGDLKLTPLLMEYIYVPAKGVPEFRETHSDAIKAILTGIHSEGDKDKIVAYIKDMVHNAPKLEEGAGSGVIKGATQKFLEIMRDNGFTNHVDQALRDLNRGDLHNQVFPEVAKKVMFERSGSHGKINGQFSDLVDNVYDLVKCASDGNKSKFEDELRRVVDIKFDKNNNPTTTRGLLGQEQKYSEAFREEYKNADIPGCLVKQMKAPLTEVVSFGSVEKVKYFSEQNTPYLALAKAGGTYLADFNKAIVKHGNEDTVKNLQELAAGILDDKEQRKYLPVTSIHELEKMRDMNPTFEKLKQKAMDGRKTKPKAAIRQEEGMESGKYRDAGAFRGKKGGIER